EVGNRECRLRTKISDAHASVTTNVTINTSRTKRAAFRGTSCADAGARGHGPAPGSGCVAYDSVGSGSRLRANWAPGGSDRRRSAPNLPAPGRQTSDRAAEGKRFQSRRLQRAAS